MKVTNNSKALQGLNTTEGVVYLRPGESRDDMKFSDDELAHIKRLTFIEIDQSDVAGSTESRDDMKKQADELGLDYPKNIPTEKLKEMIDAKLAA